MECMRRADAGNISTEQWKSYSNILGFPSAPTIDGVFLPKHPDDLLKEGDFKNASILIGTNQDEGKIRIKQRMKERKRERNKGILI